MPRFLETDKKRISTSVDNAVNDLRHDIKRENTKIAFPLSKTFFFFK